MVLTVEVERGAAAGVVVDHAHVLHPHPMHDHIVVLERDARKRALVTAICEPLSGSHMADRRPVIKSVTTSHARRLIRRTRPYTWLLSPSMLLSTPYMRTGTAYASRCFALPLLGFQLDTSFLVGTSSRLLLTRKGLGLDRARVMTHDERISVSSNRPCR